MGKAKWLRDRLKSLSSKTETGIHKKIRGLGEKLGSPIRRGIKSYTGAVKKEKTDKSNFEKARGIYKEKTGNNYPVNHLYTTPETRSKFNKILEELRNK